jgi:hypothetical protein
MQNLFFNLILSITFALSMNKLDKKNNLTKKTTC